MKSVKFLLLVLAVPVVLNADCGNGCPRCPNNPKSVVVEQDVDDMSAASSHEPSRWDRFRTDVEKHYDAAKVDAEKYLHEGEADVRSAWKHAKADAKAAWHDVEADAESAWDKTKDKVESMWDRFKNWLKSEDTGYASSGVEDYTGFLSK